MLAGGLATAAVGMLLLGPALDSTNYWQLIAPMALVGVGMGSCRKIRSLRRALELSGASA